MLQRATSWSSSSRTAVGAAQHSPSDGSHGVMVFCWFFNVVRVPHFFFINWKASWIKPDGWNLKNYLHEWKVFLLRCWGNEMFYWTCLATALQWSSGAPLILRDSFWVPSSTSNGMNNPQEYFSGSNWIPWVYTLSPWNQSKPAIKILLDLQMTENKNRIQILFIQ